MLYGGNQGEAKGTVLVQPGEEVEKGSGSSLSLSKGACREHRARLFSKVHGTRKRQQALVQQIRANKVLFLLRGGDGRLQRPCPQSLPNLSWTVL